MGSRIHNYLLKNLRMNYADIFNNASDFRFTRASEVIIIMNDGVRLVYNDMDKTVRELPSADTLSKDQCVREFGFRLRSIMHQKGVTQAELAVRTGMPQTSLSRYVNGKHEPGLYNVDRIATALGCSVDDLRVTE